MFSDKMNYRKAILSGALLALVMLVTTNVFFSSSALAVGVNTSTSPNSGLTVFTVKKAVLICDSGAQAPANQIPPEIGGCIDVTNPDHTISGNVTDFRFNEYLFTGEVLDEIVVARDLSGAQFLGSTANLLVNGTSVVTCPDVTSVGYPTGSPLWYGHGLSSLFSILPPKQGVSDTTGFNGTFDRIYDCRFTVTNQNGAGNVTVQVSDLSNAIASTDPQKWFFNPAISIDVSFSSGNQVIFPATQAGQTVYSTNTLMIKNTALGGVDLAVYLTGNDLADTSGSGLCPNSNILNVSNIAYRCKVGTFMSEVFTPLPHLKEANTCHDLSTRQCLVEDKWTPKNDLLPDATSEFTSLLYNGHTAECWFQLNVPLPCIGSYSAAKAVDVLVRAI